MLMINKSPKNKVSKLDLQNQIQELTSQIEHCQARNVHLEECLKRFDKKERDTFQEHKTILRTLEHFQRSLYTLENQIQTLNETSAKNNQHDVDIRNFRKIIEDFQGKVNHVTKEVEKQHEGIEMTWSRKLEKVIKELNFMRGHILDVDNRLRTVEAHAQKDGNNKDRSFDESQITSLTNHIQDIERTLTNLQQLISAQQEELQSWNDNKEKMVSSFSNNVTSSDASPFECFTWKIRKVAELRDKAKNVSGSSCLSSPPFFTGPYGYKMRMDVYLNGNGNAKGTHLSAFLVLLKHNYDDILDWPLPYKITWALLDQSGENQHKLFVLRNSENLGRPKADAAQPYGSPKFLSLSELDMPSCKYVKSDSIVFRVKMERCA